MTLVRLGSRIPHLVLLVALGSGAGCSADPRAGTRGGGTGGAADGGGPAEASGWVHAAGSAMPGRWLHTVRTLNNKLFLLGGKSSGSVPRNDVWRSADRRSWDLVPENAAFPSQVT